MTKGLLDVFTVEEEGILEVSNFGWDIEQEEPVLWEPDQARPMSAPKIPPRFAFVKFTHRSIPDFLLSIIQERAKEYFFEDTDVATAIITTLISETNSTYNETELLA